MRPQDRTTSVPLTTRAVRWVTSSGQRIRRRVHEIAEEPNCGWHTVNDVVCGFGDILISESGAEQPRPCSRAQRGALRPAVVRSTPRSSLRRPPRHRPGSLSWGSHDMGIQALDVVEWAICYCSCDHSDTYRSVFESALPSALLVADPIHLIKPDNKRPYEGHRRV